MNAERGTGSAEQLLAIVALGSNLGDSPQIVRSAMEQLQQYSCIPLLSSSLWRNDPVGCPPGSPEFINAVAGLVPLPGETPETLLGKLQKLEREFGRQPGKVLNESRLLDLDLIAFGREVRDSAELRLPHPRACLRRFVLEPLTEIAPDLVLPEQSKTVLELLSHLGDENPLRRIR